MQAYGREEPGLIECLLIDWTKVTTRGSGTWLQKPKRSGPGRMLGTAPLPCDGSAATTASEVTNSCASTPSRDSCFQSTLWMSETTSYPALAEVRKPQALGPTGICLPSLSFQTPYAPAPTSALWYNTLVLALCPISILAFPSCPCMGKPTLALTPAIFSTLDLILTSVLPLAYFSPQAMDTGMGPAVGMGPTMAVKICAVTQN